MTMEAISSAVQSAVQNVVAPVAKEFAKKGAEKVYERAVESTAKRWVEGPKLNEGQAVEEKSLSDKVKGASVKVAKFVGPLLATVAVMVATKLIIRAVSGGVV